MKDEALTKFERAAFYILLAGLLLEIIAVRL